MVDDMSFPWTRPTEMSKKSPFLDASTLGARLWDLLASLGEHLQESFMPIDDFASNLLSPEDAKPFQFLEVA